MNRKFLTFLACVLLMPLATRMLDGVHAENMQIALGTGVLLGVAYLLLRPILRILTFPIGCITFGLSGFVLDAAIIYGIAQCVPGFAVDGIVWACLTAALVDGVCLIIGGVKA